MLKPLRISFVAPVILGLFFIVVVVGGRTALVNAQAGGLDKRAELEKQIEGLEKEAESLDKIVRSIQGEKRTLDNEIKSAKNEIKKRELEIKRLDLAARKAGLEIEKKIVEIGALEDKIGSTKKSLTASLFLLYTYDEEGFLPFFLKNGSLADFLSSLSYLHKIQESIKSVLTAFKDDYQEFSQQKVELEEFKEDQQELKSLREIERRSLSQKQQEKDQLLKLTKGKEEIFQQILKAKKRDIATLKTQLFYLEKTGITAEDAIKFAELAATRVGIRPAFLLALLEVETGRQLEDGVISIGTNIGTGNWKRDLYDCYVNLRKPKTAEAEKTAFLQITGKLNLDPNKMPVSRRPNYGCGGAMGPAQFLPTTWLRFEKRVASLTGHNPPSPWNVGDAFTAAAVFLADAGAIAQNEKGETQAAKTYLSGRPNCTRSICKFYANRILSLARDIDRIL